MVKIVLFCFYLLIVVHGEQQRIEIRMPSYDVDKEDAYLCTSLQLPSDPMKLIAVEPISDQDTVHHMLLFGSFPTFAEEFLRMDV